MIGGGEWHITMVQSGILITRTKRYRTNYYLYIIDCARWRSALRCLSLDKALFFVMGALGVEYMGKISLHTGISNLST